MRNPSFYVQLFIVHINLREGVFIVVSTGVFYLDTVGFTVFSYFNSGLDNTFVNIQKIRWAEHRLETGE
jgi:hypothetical protein